jgi:predicted nucleotidyltransferase
MAKKKRDVKKIITEYINRLNRLGIEVSQIILYGSYAKGNPREYSDIDIAVVSQTFNKLDIFERQDLLSKAHHRLAEPIEPIGLTPDQMKEKKGFVREIIDKGIIIYSNPALS